MACAGAANVYLMRLVLLLPPFIIDGLKAIKCVPAGKWGNIITQLGRTARLL